MNQYPMRFAVAYAAIGAVLIAAIIGFVVIVLTPATPVAHKSDIRAALGASDRKAVVIQAEQYVVEGAKQAGIVVLGTRAVSVTQPKKDEIVVVVEARTAELGKSQIAVTFYKGIYSIVSTKQIK